VLFGIQEQEQEGKLQEKASFPLTLSRSIFFPSFLLTLTLTLTLCLSHTLSHSHSLTLSLTLSLSRSLPPPPKKKMPSSAAQKRAQREARFAAKQASLPQIERLENRADLEERSQKTYAFSTAYQHRLSKAWFLEFVQLTSPNDFDPNYFEKEGPLPTPGLIKRYAVYLSQSRVGRINDKISAPSILHMIKQLLTQFERHRRRDFVKADRTDIYNYIRHDLVKQEGLTTLMKPKPICLSEDTTYIMSVLYSPAYLATFSHMRNVLNITLYINLMIDSAGRGGDILHTRGMVFFFFFFSSSSFERNFFY